MFDGEMDGRTDRQIDGREGENNMSPDSEGGDMIKTKQIFLLRCFGRSERA